jgi:hypothetical protein
MPIDLRNRSFVKLLDFSADEIRQLLRLSRSLKKAKKDGTEEPRLVGKLEEYARYTPAQTVTKSESAEQQAARTGDAIVRNATAPMAVVGGASVIVGGTRRGRGGMVIPVQGSDSHEPLVIERRRVKSSRSMATSHETVTRRGNEIISIDKDELHQRDHTSMVPPLD